MLSRLPRLRCCPAIAVASTGTESHLSCCNLHTHLKENPQTCNTENLSIAFMCCEFDAKEQTLETLVRFEESVRNNAPITVSTRPTAGGTRGPSKPTRLLRPSRTTCPRSCATDATTITASTASAPRSTPTTARTRPQVCAVVTRCGQLLLQVDLW